MGKSRKRQKNGLINGSKAPQVRAATERAAAGHHHNENLAGDDYEPPSKEPRKFQNQSSMFLMVISVLSVVDLVILRSVFAEMSVFFLKINQPVAHEPVVLTQN